MSKERTSEYEDILAQCLTAVLEDDRTIAECVLAYPHLADTLKQDLGIAVMTSRLDVPQMDADSVDALEVRLRQMMLAQTPVTAVSTPRNIIPFRIPFALSRTAAAVLILLMLAFAGSAGTVAASSDSMPGETLYPVKRLWESVIIIVATVAGNLDDVWVQLAETRLLEAQHEYDEGQLSAEVLADLYEATDKAVEHALGSPELQVYLVVLADSLQNGSLTLDADTTHSEIIDLIAPVLENAPALLTPQATQDLSTTDITATATQIITLSPTLQLTLTATQTHDTLTITPANLVMTASVDAGVVEASNTIAPSATSTSRIPPTPTRTPTPTTTATVTSLPVNVPSATFTPLPPPTFGNPPTAQVGAPNIRPSPTFDGGTPTPYPTWYPYPRLTQEAFYLTRTAEWQGGE